MHFRILGSLEIYDDYSNRRIIPTGSKQRALLTALVVKSGHVLSVHRLIDELWAENPPANAANALQAHVARLRRLLAGEQEQDDPHREQEWIVTRSLGYLFSTDFCTTDAEQFHQLFAEGRALTASHPERAADALRRALDLWRGPALEDSVTGDICAAKAAQLEENRLAALETLYDAKLRAGRHAEITGELEELTTTRPMRERFYDLLMVALYRSGRQAEALGVYDRARKHLVSELGVEPGPAMRDRMQEILNQSPGLEEPRQRTTAVGTPAPAPEPVDEPAFGAADSTAGNGDVNGEIERLRRRVEALSEQQAALTGRFQQLAAMPQQCGCPSNGTPWPEQQARCVTPAAEVPPPRRAVHRGQFQPAFIGCGDRLARDTEAAPDATDPQPPETVPRLG